MKHVLHVEDEPITDLIDGKLYTIPPNEVTEIENDFHCEKLLEHKHYHGLVIVTGTKTPRGVEFDYDEAIKEAKEVLAVKELETVAAYVNAQMEDKVSKGLPARPPEGRVKKIIKKLGINLARDYNLQILGQPTGAAVAQSDVTADLRRQLEAERLRNDTLDTRLKNLETALSTPAGVQTPGQGQDKDKTKKAS